MMNEQHPPINDTAVAVSSDWGTMDRDNHICPHFGLCGGCSRQDRSYDNQLREKASYVEKCLGDYPIEEFLPIIPSPETVFYRNKMEFSFGDEKDIAILARDSAHPDVQGNPEKKVHLGLHPRGRFALVAPTPACALLSPESQRLIQIVGDWATNSGNPVYVRKNNRGVLRHLVIREGKNTGERMANLVATSGIKGLEELAEHLQKSSARITTFLWTRNDGLSDVATGQETTAFWGLGFIRERLGRASFRVGPASFMQTNTRAAERMIDILEKWTNSRGAVAGTLLDLYCGSGALGLNLAVCYRKVIGVELNAQAIEDARVNASENGIQNAEFLNGALEKVVLTWDRFDPETTTVIVDPPRSGLHKNVVEWLCRWKPVTIFYISCNPMSLARDLQALVPIYRIRSVQPMDFFPHTDHVETAVHLEIRRP